MKFALPINLPVSSILFDGVASNFQSTLNLNLIGHKFAKGKTTIVWCCYSKTDGQELIVDMNNWLREMEVNLPRKQLELGLNYIDNADAMTGKALAEKIAELAKSPHTIVVRDTSREFGDAQNHWHTFNAPILQKIRATVIHVGKTDVMGANGANPANYKHHYRVKSWRAGQWDQLNEACLIERSEEGQPLTPWVFREQPGVVARVWRMTDEQPGVAA
jgi:hypothetical protein